MSSVMDMVWGAEGDGSEDERAAWSTLPVVEEDDKFAAALMFGKWVVTNPEMAAYVWRRGSGNRLS